MAIGRDGHFFDSYRRPVRRRLIERRKELGLSQLDLANRIGASSKTVHRYESGASSPHPSGRKTLAAALDWSAAQLTLALTEHDASPLNGHRVSRLGHLVSLEQGAAELCTFETTVMPGLLQTLDYATVVESVAPDRPSPAEVARRVALRMRRQNVLDSLRLRALLDASILQRETGGPAVMARQLDHLRAMAARPNIDVRILPLDERAHAAGRGSFMLYSHSEDDLPFMVVIDTAAGPEYLGKEHDVTAHTELWAYLWRIGDELA